MASLIVYKVALVVLLVSTASLGGSAYYSQQQIATLNNKVSSLSGQVSNSTNQGSSQDSKIVSLNNQIAQLQSLNLQMQTENSQLAKELGQLQSEVTQLQGQIQNLTKTGLSHSILVSSGTISLPEGGTASTIQYISFSVPSSMKGAYINLTFAETPGNAALKVALLNQTQYQQFTCCDTTNAYNYTLLTTTWSSPWSQSYTAQVSLPSVGNWYVAFLPTSGYIYGGIATETITLTTQS